MEVVNVHRVAPVLGQGNPPTKSIYAVPFLRSLIMTQCTYPLSENKQLFYMLRYNHGYVHLS